LTHVERHLRVASGLLSLGFGLFLVYQIGFVSGLFTGHAVWTPK
jgi:high-affinity nickel-transport protein